MTRQSKGPEFLRYVAPILETLKAMGGSGYANAVAEATMDRVGLSPAVREETTSNGQSRARNRIGWARFYLDKAGLMWSPQRAVWALTPQGQESTLDEAAVFELYRSVQSRFRRLAEETEGDAPLPEEKPDERGPGSPAATDGGVEAEVDDQGEQGIHSPYDASKTHIVTKQMSVEQFVKRMRHDEIELNPDFQRKSDLWTHEQKSRLIESMLIRIPLPVFYFDATEDTKWIVVDGLQRLSTIRHFMTADPSGDRLKLSGLEYLHQYDGQTFDELPRDLQRRIEETQVFAHLIQPGTPPEVKYNIFKRINTGGLVLSAQEIRHALFQKKNGAVTVLHELADSEEFMAATSGAIQKDRMLDCEFVLRFASFTLSHYLTYREPDMEGFLNRHMKALNDQGEGPARDDLRRRFSQAMRAAAEIFGNDAFRKRYSPEDGRKPINKALFEVWSVGLGRLSQDEITRLVSAKETVASEAAEVLRDDKDFEASISQGTGEPRRVHKRFSTVEEIIRHHIQETA